MAAVGRNVSGSTRYLVEQIVHYLSYPMRALYDDHHYHIVGSSLYPRSPLSCLIVDCPFLNKTTQIHHDGTDDGERKCRKPLRL